MKIQDRPRSGVVARFHKNCGPTGNFHRSPTYLGSYRERGHELCKPSRIRSIGTGPTDCYP
jgi:hypothetical protein